MKDEDGNVLIDGYYDGIEINRETQRLLESVPYDRENLNKTLGISESEKVGNTYQESLQYPTLNIRQIGTSWKGEGLKTVIPEYARADIDIRLVPETKGKDQIEKIKKHIESEGYYVIDREPTNQERQNHTKIVKFVSSKSMDAFRTNPDSNFGQKIRASLKTAFDRDPVAIRLMGGTVPIVPLINELNVPTVIIPMVNMDNNQHSPNENIRIGNIHQGINICLTLLDSSF
jgi:acetylornithine deacetylase/succinyl-diaminopimelate desuccinylase-like protein